MIIRDPSFTFNSWLRIFAVVFICCFCHTVGKRNCSSNVCFNGGVCVVDDAAGVFQCECQPGFNGTLCESALPCSLDCRNGGLCSFDEENHEICQCPEGFTGELCTSTADCLVTGCLEGEICLLNASDQKWSCSIDHCFTETPCKNNATCRPTRSSYICECPLGFTGKQCETDVDECLAEHPCRNNATCLNLPGGFRCQCPVGFNGQLCEQKVGFCVQNPCTTHGECVEQESGYSCTCHAGYTGDHCERDAPICVCENESHECTLIGGKPTCKCPEGTRGANCDEPVDLCQSQNPCQNGGQCIANGNQTFCICSSQFTGQFCQNKVLDCLVDDKPCLNGGKCLKGESNNSVENKCECIGRFMGKWCEQMRLNAHLNTSNSSPKDCPSGYCGNGGKCKMDRGKPTCSCVDGFSGSRCQQAASKDLCLPNPCLNQGQCQTDGRSVSCFCTEAFTGKHCEIACNCENDQVCRESVKTPGSAECLTVPPSEVLIPDNTSEFSFPTTTQATRKTTNEMLTSARTIIPNLKTSTPLNLATDFPSPPSLYRNNTGTPIKPTTKFSDSEPVTATNSSPVELGPFDGLLNVTSCDDCVNAYRCLQIDQRNICLCQHDFTGAYCDEPITPCSSTSCQNGQVCRLQRSGSSELAQCACQPGLFGVNCQEPTTATFKTTSLLLYQPPEVPSGNRNKRSTEYSLIFSFRTTLPAVHFVTGENLVGARQFSVELEDGFLILRMKEEKMTVLDMELNDGEWYSVWIVSTGNSMTVEVEDAASSYILTRNKQQITPLTIFTTRFGKVDKGYFVGCLRDAFVNGQLVDLLSDDRSIDINPGCQRKEQCVAEKCQNGAKCIDLWDHFKCQCKRPYLEPTCVQKLSEVTFGHDNISSVIEYSIDGEDATAIRQKLDFGFILRTNKDYGVVAFLGNRSQDEDLVGTFIGAEVIDGKLAVSGRLGGKRILTLNLDKKVDDNKEHLVEIQRTGNDFRIKVDGKQEGILQFKQPFEHPLLADSLILGSEAPIVHSPFNPNSGHFKGTLQDVRINQKSVLLTDEPDGIEVDTFGQKLNDQNILPGTISDDICAFSKPCLQGKCFNTFNDFECQCDPGWIGRDCGKKDFCSDKPCPSGSECKNTHGGFICTSAATFNPTTMAKYSLFLPENNLEKRTNANFTFEMRTRSKQGQVVRLQTSTDSLAMFLTDNGVSFIYSNSTNSIKDPLALNIKDGQWHTVVLRESAKSLSVEFDSLPSAPLLAPFSLTKFITDKNARLVFGKSFNATGYKGCLQNVVFNALPQVSFLASEVFGGGLQNTTHFVPMLRENLKSDGCISKEVCGALNPCKNGASCVDLFNLRECRCVPGFSGEFCHDNVNDCGEDNEEKCSYAGQCVDAVNGFSCQCYKGFSGDFCENVLDQCANSPCLNGGECQTEPDATYTCTCLEDFFGARCQQKKAVQCDARPCENGGTCRVADSGVECVCPPFYRGALCEDAVDMCSPSQCKNGGKCTDTGNGTFHCDCPEQYSGETCAQLVDVCFRGSDKNTPTCVHGMCQNIWGGFLCQCDEGWTGNRCEIDVDECLDFPCENNGTCLNTAGGYRCECREFYLGDRCETVGVCATQPCVHGACAQPSATEFTCNCEKGYQGDRCSEQIDYCQDEPCRNGATCQKLVGGFKCLCIAGFMDDTCSTDIDDCVQGSCANHGKCIDRVNGFECNCNGTGFRGAQCTEDIDECSAQLISNHCVNGLCQNSPGAYTCQCEEGFIGQKCNMVDPCVPDVLNRTLHNCVHGICRHPAVVTLPSGREVAQHDCECFGGYTGPQCTHRVEKHNYIALGYIIGPIAAICIVLCLLGCMLFLFVARNKRANQGHYSPTTNETTGSRMQHFSDVQHGSSKATAATLEQAPPRTPDIKLKIRPAPSPPKRQINHEPLAVGTTWAFAIHPTDETL